nr:MAG: 100 kDa protein [unidentified adenovirus]
MTESEDKISAASDNIQEVQTPTVASSYLHEDSLLTHINRQANIVFKALQNSKDFKLSIEKLSKAYEESVFAQKESPKRDGTQEKNADLHFYPPFIIPETLASYHLFFINISIPHSCKANQPDANQILTLDSGATFPLLPDLDKDFVIDTTAGSYERDVEVFEDSALIRMINDNFRLKVLKQMCDLCYFSYPAMDIVPSVMQTVTKVLLQKDEENKENAVSAREICKWTGINENDTAAIEERKRCVLKSVLFGCQMLCMEKFFKDKEIIVKLQESLHYMFLHGYVKNLQNVCSVTLSNLISYLGIMHENRLGQATLHHTLESEDKIDYIRDTAYLFLVLTWQTAMGVWKQCMDPNNVKDLELILQQERENLWKIDDVYTMSTKLADLIFPEKLVKALKEALPDFSSQSALQNFRSFILERSGCLPAFSLALPTDFIPISFCRAPPSLWPHTYCLLIANYLVYHGALYIKPPKHSMDFFNCPCNLCSPHRSFVFNDFLKKETDLINAFTLQGPESGKQISLTPAVWGSAYLKKMSKTDFNAFSIKHYNDKDIIKEPLTPCVLTEGEVIDKLTYIKKCREKFLTEKGSGVYIDPDTGDILNARSAPHFTQNAS